MGLGCKICKFETKTQIALLKHYRLYHGHGGQPVPCLYQDCFCSFRTWGSLRSHLSRHHSKGTQERFRSAESISFTCPCCNAKTISTERELFEHLGRHLKKHETVICVFQNCNFSTNIYGTFASHRSRKHTPHSLTDFKEDIIKRFVSSANTDQHSDVEIQDRELPDDGQDDDNDVRVLPNHIEKMLALLFLKLESTFNVSNRCIDEVVEELNFISHSASGPIIKHILQSCLRKHNCEIDESVVSDMVTELCVANPFTSALSSSGPLSSAYKRRSYYIEQFDVVEPVEYVLDREENRSFQYVPILKSLLQVLSQKEIRDLILKNREAQSNSETQYRAFSDGIYYKTNELFSAEDPTIAIILYVDDFEICNPLGTSRKKHKVTAVYWVLADVPALLRSSLTSIFLAILCKADDVKRFGYSTVLQPLLKDLVSLEEEGLYVPALGKIVKGTVFCVITFD